MPLATSPSLSPPPIRAFTGARHVFARDYKLPIVFVPGIMGSRLIIHERGGAVPWEPDRKTSILTNFAVRSPAIIRRRMNPALRTTFPQNLRGPDLFRTASSADLQRYRDEIREIARSSPSGYHAAPAIEGAAARFEQEEQGRLIRKGWNEVAWSFYGPLLEGLETRSFRGASCPAYAVGYDWRGSNARSAQRLHRRIGEILEEERAEQVVVVTHSMGGLVARSCIEQYGEERVFAVVHVTQPAYGAPLLYRRFKTGGVYMGHGADGAMALLLGTTPEKTATALSISDGGLELLPSNTYRMRTGAHAQFPAWLSWDGSLPAGRSFSQPPPDVHALYREPTGRIGIIPPGFSHNADFEQRLQRAEAFQRTIDGVYHARTYWVCSEGETTDVAVRIEPLEYEEARRISYVNGVPFAHTVRQPRPYRGPRDTRAHDDEELGIRVVHYFPEGMSDGTVPSDSQHGYAIRPGARPPAGVLQVQNVAHDEACADPVVVEQIGAWVEAMIPDYAVAHGRF